MNEYAVEVMETLSRVVNVDAESEEDAVSKVWDMYYEEEIVLDSLDFIVTEINIYEE